MYIFLDESGDLGFDFTKKGTSAFFVVTLLVIEEPCSIKTISLAVTKTLKKINYKKNCANELKGAHTPIQVKKYFLDKTADSNWILYAIVVDKKKFRMPKYIHHPDHLYNYIVGCLFNKVVIDNPQSAIVITVDKCKTSEQIHEFNRHVEEVICSKLSSTCNLTITHKQSYDDKLLQAVDLFCSGIAFKYENRDLSWYSCFQNRICIEHNI
jgi:hypothetical protein